MSPSTIAEANNSTLLYAKTSPFTLIISGTAFNGQGSGTFAITFQTVGWPDRILGSWEGTRTSGSGITTVQSKGLPWIMLLLTE